MIAGRFFKLKKRACKTD